MRLKLQKNLILGFTQLELEQMEKQKHLLPLIHLAADMYTIMLMLKLMKQHLILLPTRLVVNILEPPTTIS